MKAEGNVRTNEDYIEVRTQGDIADHIARDPCILSII